MKKKEEMSDFQKGCGCILIGVVGISVILGVVYIIIKFVSFVVSYFLK